MNSYKQFKWTITTSAKTSEISLGILISDCKAGILNDLLIAIQIEVALKLLHNQIFIAFM